MVKQSQYDKRKEVEGLIKDMEPSKRKMAFEMLLADWAGELPQKAKDYGVTASGSKWAARLEWLQEQWGTPFETKGTNAIRKMPLSGVLELLALFTLKAADSTEEKASFGVLDDGSKLAEAVVPQLRAMKDAVGPKLEITKSAVKQLDQLREDCDAMTPEEMKKALEQIKKQITG
jgi:hypothetical protein